MFYYFDLQCGGDDLRTTSELPLGLGLNHLSIPQPRAHDNHNASSKLLERYTKRKDFEQHYNLDIYTEIMPEFNVLVVTQTIHLK